ncbi:MAG: ATP-binding protein [Deltaproteobacteria bacterium]|nr:ATP-binding protein [Deltaproteobacteria bacterium]
MHKRILDLNLSQKETCFLWGPRQTGKSTLLRVLFPKAKRYDLLLSSEFRRLTQDPDILREECLALGLSADTQVEPIIIDEIQKIPELLDTVHWLIENKGLRFLLCGSSARKVKRGHANLLGGRAVRYELYPLVFPEIDNFSLDQALNRGLLPRHYSSEHYPQLLRAYVDDYLKEEIHSEALVRNLPAFSRFLEVAGVMNGEIVNYTNIASDVGVSSSSVKQYFQILVDTLIGSYLPVYQKRAKRRLIASPKFYFFDLGLVNHLAKRQKIERGSTSYGSAFEHFIYQQLIAHSSYRQRHYPISYWRTSSGFEVDFVLGDEEVAIEVKSTEKVNNTHLKGLRAFKEEHLFRRYIVVSLDAKLRRTDDKIDIIPWNIFMKQLWNDELL